MATKGFWSGATIQLVPVKNERDPMVMLWTGSGGHLYELEDITADDGRLSHILQDTCDENRHRYLTWLEVWPEDLKEGVRNIEEPEDGNDKL